MLPTVLQCPYPGGKGLRSSLAFDLLCYFVYLGEDIAVAVDEVGYLRGGVHDGGVVPPAEGLPYLGQRFIGELSGEVHGDLAGVGQDAHQGPLKLADVRRNLRRDERQHLIVYLEAVHDRLFAKDRYPRL